MQKIFTTIYETKVWGDNRNEEYCGSSGPGSQVDFNIPYIVFIRNFIKSNNIKSVADVGCGDFRCAESIYKGSVSKKNH